MPSQTQAASPTWLAQELQAHADELLLDEATPPPEGGASAPAVEPRLEQGISQHSSLHTPPL